MFLHSSLLGVSAAPFEALLSSDDLYAFQGLMYPLLGRSWSLPHHVSVQDIALTPLDMCRILNLSSATS